MAVKWQYIYGLDSEDPSDGPFGVSSVKLPNVATASLPAAAAANEGNIVYDETTSSIKFSDGASWAAIGVAGGATLDSAYNGGSTIDVDTNAVTMTVSDTDNNAVLSLVQNDTTNNPVMLQLANTGTGSDIDGDNWSMSQAGLLTCADIACSGSIEYAGASVTGDFAVGIDGTGHEVHFYTDTVGDYMFFDDVNKVMQFIDVKVHMSDTDTIEFGAGSGIGSGDFALSSDGTDITLVAGADVASQAFKIGDNTNDIDLIWYADAAGAEVTFDSSGNAIIVDGVDLRMNDEDYITFGDGADFTLRYEDAGKDLILVAAADVADQAFIIGDATNDMDIMWYGNTAGDLVLFDSSDDSVLFTDIDLSIQETGVETALTVSSASIGTDSISLTGTGVLTNGFAALHVYGTGNIATGGAVCMLEAKTGTPAAGSLMLELVGTGKNIRGIVADVDQVEADAYVFHSGGATATTKSVMRVSADGAPADATVHILEVDGSNGTWGAVNCVPFSVLNSGAGYTAILENTVTGALGSVLALQHNPAAEADGDVACRIQFIGSDSAHADESAGRIDCVMRDETAANPDFDMIFYTDVAGTETARLELNDYGVSVVAGILTTESTTDLVLNTNHSTNSSSITITDAAAGNITLAMDTTAQATILSTDAGALGAVLNLSMQNGAGLEAAGDVVGRIQFIGKDDADAEELSGRIDSVARDVAAANPDFDMIFYTDIAGTETALLELNATGVCLPTGILTTLSTIDMVIDTNEGTNSGSITIADGVDGDITLVGNGAGSIVLSGAGLQYQARDIAAGTLTDTADTTDGLIQVSTDGANDCVATVPEAASNLGLVLTYQHDADGGNDVVVTRTGADTFDEDGDTGNVTYTMANTGECIQIMAVSDNQWMIIARVGGTLA